MRVLGCGGRNFSARWLNPVLDEIHRATPITEMIHGGARGADYWCGQWAIRNGIKITVVEAEWDKYGKRAGRIRNTAMADLKPDLVVVFPGGFGTKMMLDIAREKGLKVFVPLETTKLGFEETKGNSYRESKK